MRQRAQEDWHSHCPPRRGSASSSEADQSLRCPPCRLNHRWVEPLLPRWEETVQAPRGVGSPRVWVQPQGWAATRPPSSRAVPVSWLVCPPRRGWRQPTASSQDSAGSQCTPTRYRRDPRRGRGRWLRLQCRVEWLCGETQPDAQAGSEVGAGLRAAQRHRASRCPGCLLPQTAEEACASALVSVCSGLQPGQGPRPLSAFLGQLRTGVWEDWALPGQVTGAWVLPGSGQTGLHLQNTPSPGSVLLDYKTMLVVG